MLIKKRIDITYTSSVCKRKSCESKRLMANAGNKLSCPRKSSDKRSVSRVKLSKQTVSNTMTRPLSDFVSSTRLAEIVQDKEFGDGMSNNMELPSKVIVCELQKVGKIGSSGGCCSRVYRPLHLLIVIQLSEQPFA